MTMTARYSVRCAWKEWAIQTPSAGVVRVESNGTAAQAVRAYERSRWPLRWLDLHAMGYRVVPVR